MAKLLSRRDFLKLTGVGVGGAAALGCLAEALAGSALQQLPARRSAVKEQALGAKAVVHDGTICIGCRFCEAACADANALPAPDPTSPHGKVHSALCATTWTRVCATEIRAGGEVGRVFTKLQCMHCLHPACVEACIVGALQKRPDGPVTYDENKCIGCRYCQVACPFGVPNFEWDSPTPWIRKCSFCAERQDRGQPPACVAACIPGALKFGDREALLAEARERIAAAPNRYVDHIYGEKEVGGTSWLYLSPVPFEVLGCRPHGAEPVTVNAARAMGLVPPVLVGVGACVTGIYWLTKRRLKLSQAEMPASKRKG